MPSSTRWIGSVVWRAEQLVHQALEVGRQVLDDDEGHPACRRQGVEEALERLEPAGGGADADDQEVRCRVPPVPFSLLMDSLAPFFTVLVTLLSVV